MFEASTKKSLKNRHIIKINACNLKMSVVLSLLLMQIFERGDNMKEGIHPQYEKVTVRCACGAEFETRSTKKDIRLDVCSKCHPFFTGKQKLVDTGGRVDRFKKRFGIEDK